MSSGAPIPPMGATLHPRSPSDSLPAVLECVLNVSEGRDGDVLAALAEAAGAELLDVHRDPYHHRAVLTLVGEDAPRRVAEVAVERIDLRRHAGVHPRIGAVDVVPFVPLAGSTMDDAVAARDRFAEWFASGFGVPCFLYGPPPAPSLPEVRRWAFTSNLTPAFGPAAPHVTAGACAVGAREVLVAWNLWVDTDLVTARRVAATIRGDGIRALGLPVGDRVQVSMNLVEPLRVGPAEAWDRVAALAPVRGAELVGLVPTAVLERTPRDRWRQLDLDEDRTIEARLARARRPTR